MGKFYTSESDSHGEDDSQHGYSGSDRRRDPKHTNETQQDTETHWYIVALPNGCCEVVAISDKEQQPDRNAKERRIWGPFRSYKGAIARRIGLIRSGKCKPY